MTNNRVQLMRQLAATYDTDGPFARCKIIEGVRMSPLWAKSFVVMYDKAPDDSKLKSSMIERSMTAVMSYVEKAHREGQFTWKVGD